jgi:hypothetical protein
MYVPAATIAGAYMVKPRAITPVMALFFTYAAIASEGCRSELSHPAPGYGYRPQDPLSRWKYLVLAQRQRRVPTMMPAIVTKAGRYPLAT